MPQSKTLSPRARQSAASEGRGAVATPSTSPAPTSRTSGARAGPAGGTAAPPPPSLTEADGGSFRWHLPAAGRVRRDLPVWRALTGQPVEAVQGLGWLDAVHPEERDRVRTAWEQAIATNRPLGLTCRVCDQDGIYRQLSLHLLPLRDRRGRLSRWEVTCLDVTARTTYEQEREERLARAMAAHHAEAQAKVLQREQAARAAAEAANQQLRQLQALTDTALSHLALDDLLPMLVPRVRDVLAADLVTILLLDADAQQLAVRSELRLADDESTWAPIPFGEGFAGRIAASRAPLVVEDLSTFPLVRPQLRQTIRSAVGVPLLAGEHLLGVLCIGTAQTRHFSQQDVVLLEQAAERIATAIERTQLFEAEQTVRRDAVRENARWQAAMESVPELVVTCDADVRITYVNPAYERLRGGAADSAVPVEELSTRYGLLLPDGKGPIPAEELPLTRAVREGQPIHGAEMVVRLPDGEERLLVWEAAPMRSPEGELLGAVAIGRDITERTQLEREREAARAEAERQAEQLDRIIEAMADGVTVWNAQGQLVRTNAALRRMMALDTAAPPDYFQRPPEERMALYEPRDAQGHLLAAEDWPVTRALRGEVLTGAQAVDLYMRTFEGRELVFTASAAPLRDQDGRVVGAVGLLRDQTERHQLAREREAARASELALREVNERLDTFVAMAAHDLRHPVGVSKLAVEQAQRQVLHASARMRRASSTQTLSFIEVERALETTVRHLDRLWRLLQQLLDVTRMREGTLVLNRTSCDLAALVRRAVDEQRLLTPTRTVTLDLPASGAPPLSVQADADRLGQVLANYLSNAVRYSPEDQPITVMLRAGERVARVEVQDHGPGIPPEEQERIWARFQRARSVGEALGGLGLGLYIARLLVAQHGGQVGVDSTVGQGATFWFTLPLADATA